MLQWSSQKKPQCDLGEAFGYDERSELRPARLLAGLLPGRFWYPFEAGGDGGGLFRLILHDRRQSPIFFHVSILSVDM